jgi:hypothetical protein
MSQAPALIPPCPVEKVPEGSEVKVEHEDLHVPTGRVVAPPCMVLLRTYRVHLVDGRFGIEATGS